MKVSNQWILYMGKKKRNILATFLSFNMMRWDQKTISNFYSIPSISSSGRKNVYLFSFEKWNLRNLKNLYKLQHGQKEPVLEAQISQSKEAKKKEENYATYGYYANYEAFRNSF